MGTCRLDVKGPNSGSNPTDDREIDVLEEEADNPVVQELQAAFERLNIDEQLDLLALTWLGRGEFGTFAEARKEAEGLDEVHAGRYLIGTPLLGDYLEEGLSQLGISLECLEFLRQITGIHDTIGMDNGETFNQVGKLANIAGPAILAKGIDGTR